MSEAQARQTQAILDDLVEFGFVQEAPLHWVLTFPMNLDTPREGRQQVAVYLGEAPNESMVEYRLAVADATLEPLRNIRAAAHLAGRDAGHFDAEEEQEMET